MHFQQTITEEIKAVGIGLHSGNPIEIQLQPAAPNSGIVFVRKDLEGKTITVCPENVDESRLQLATTLQENGAIVQTTEHLLSALYSLGIDNVTVILDGPEVPIMDGSAAPFIYLIEQAGIKTQKVARKVLRITKPFHFEKDGKTVSVKPSSQFKVNYKISFAHPMIGIQNKAITVDVDEYKRGVSNARTFGFLSDVNQLKKMGLIKGGSVDNAIVLDGTDILNGSLRSQDEFVAHKILDFIGDLAVCGLRLEGEFSAFKAGHEVHALFLKALLSAQDCYEVVVASEVNTPELVEQPAAAKEPAFA